MIKLAQLLPLEPGPPIFPVPNIVGANAVTQLSAVAKGAPPLKLIFKQTATPCFRMSATLLNSGSVITADQPI
jgi:hypothetical protein